MIEYLPVNQQRNYTLLAGCRNYATDPQSTSNFKKTQLIDFQGFTKFKNLDLKELFFSPKKMFFSH